MKISEHLVKSIGFLVKSIEFLVKSSESSFIKLTHLSLLWTSESSSIEFMHLRLIPKYWRRRKNVEIRGRGQLAPSPLPHVAHLTETRRANPLFGTGLDGFGLNGSCLVFIKLTLVHVCAYT